MKMHRREYVVKKQTKNEPFRIKRLKEIEMIKGCCLSYYHKLCVSCFDRERERNEMVLMVKMNEKERKSKRGGQEEPRRRRI